MEVNFVRLYFDDEHTGQWCFALCKDDKETSDIVEQVGFETPGDALDAAIEWADEKGLAIETYVPLPIYYKSHIGNVVEAASRFRPPVMFTAHPSKSS